MERDIAVVGAGPAGAGFAAELARIGQGERLLIIERDPYYRKPCGDVVLEDVMRETPVKPPVLNRIRSFELRVSGERVFHSEYESPLWYVIDKPGWVRALREYAVKHGAELRRESRFPEDLVGSFRIIVDARGPFANNGLAKLTISRAIIEYIVDPESVLIDFDPVEMGFLWVFPHADDAANIGLAYKGERSPQRRLERILEKHYPTPRIRRMDTTIITIDQPPRQPPARPPIYPIGEAAGLVHPLSGEGIRPSHLHGILLARRLAADPYPPTAYATAWEDMRPFISQMRLQKALMDMLEELPQGPERVEVMRSLSPRLYESFLRDSIGAGDIVDSLFRSPRLAWFLAPALISKLARGMV